MVIRQEWYTYFVGKISD